MDIHANTFWVSVFQVLVWKKYARLPSIILIDCNVTSFKICRLRIPAGTAYAAVCKEFSRVEAGRKCSQRKSRHVSDVPLLFAILIAHCQAAASLFDDCSTKKSRQVNLDTTAILTFRADNQLAVSSSTGCTFHPRRRLAS